jgi:hypothetical protein
VWGVKEGIRSGEILSGIEKQERLFDGRPCAENRSQVLWLLDLRQQRRKLE